MSSNSTTNRHGLMWPSPRLLKTLMPNHLSLSSITSVSRLRKLFLSLWNCSATFQRACFDINSLQVSLGACIFTNPENLLYTQEVNSYKVTNRCHQHVWKYQIQSRGPRRMPGTSNTTLLLTGCHRAQHMPWFYQCPSLMCHGLPILPTSLCRNEQWATGALGDTRYPHLRNASRSFRQEPRAI
jgi:hypothetical protein